MIIHPNCFEISFAVKAPDLTKHGYDGKDSEITAYLADVPQEALKKRYGHKVYTYERQCYQMPQKA